MNEVRRKHQDQVRDSGATCRALVVVVHHRMEVVLHPRLAVVVHLVDPDLVQDHGVWGGGFSGDACFLNQGWAVESG